METVNIPSLESNRMQSGVYGQLQENEIRILEIIPGIERDDIHCRLKYIKLDGKTEYSALSYTWGYPRKRKSQVIIDGHPMEVTENCKLALQELRKEAMIESTTQMIWIDALCINQNNNSERTQQILVMRDIYRQSKKLIV